MNLKIVNKKKYKIKLQIKFFNPTLQCTFLVVEYIHESEVAFDRTYDMETLPNLQEINEKREEKKK